MPSPNRPRITYRLRTSAACSVSPRVSCRKLVPTARSDHGSAHSLRTRQEIFQAAHHSAQTRRNGCSVALQVPTYPPAARRVQAPRFKLFGILLLVPAIIMLAALILTALLGIFVVWLAVFGTMAAALVIS